MRVDRLSLLFTYAIAGLGIGASVLHLSAAFALLLAFFVAVGVYGDIRGRHPLGSWTLTLVVVVGFLVALALPSANGPIGRMLAASIVLLGGKLLAPKAARDQFQVMLLSLLLLVGSAILAGDLSFAPLFLLYLVLCTADLVWIPFGTALSGHTVSRRFVKRVLLVGVGLIVGSVPLVLLFFVALPRAAAPLWRAAPAVSTQVSGFSDRVSLGDVSRIAESNAVAFRVELPEHDGPLQPTPYWRGLTLEATDGVTWQQRPQAPGEPGAIIEPGSEPDSLVTQVVYLEPNAEATLFGLDRIVLVDGDQVRSAVVDDGAASVAQPITQRVRYTVLSAPARLAWAPLYPLTRAADLQLPPDLPPVLAAAAAQVVGGARSPSDKARLLLEHFHSGGYTYSLSPPPGDGHPLQVFLTTKIGYCEHFASAMALMLRSVGVPARLVVGYLGGDYNPNGDYYLVRRRSAHAWVEAYIDGQGWLRLDPTPADQGPGSATTPGRAGSATLLLDSLRHRWDSMVLGYDLRAQTELLRSISDGLGNGLSSRPGPGDLAVLAILILAITSAAILFKRGEPGEPAIALYAGLQRRLNRRGVTREPAEGPRDFARRASSALPDRADTIDRVTEGYVRARYRGRRLPADEMKRLRQAVRHI